MFFHYIIGKIKKLVLKIVKYFSYLFLLGLGKKIANLLSVEWDLVGIDLKFKILGE